MKTKHTTGPWRIDETSDTQTIAVESEQAEHICILQNDNADRTDFNKQDLANAKLIAAAPELLAACQQLVAIEGDGGPCGYCRQGEDEGHAEHCPVSLARAAISKATE